MSDGSPAIVYRAPTQGLAHPNGRNSSNDNSGTSLKAAHRVAKYRIELFLNKIK